MPTGLPTFSPIPPQPGPEAVGRLPAFAGFGPGIAFPNAAPGVRHIASDHLQGPFPVSLSFTMPTNAFVLVYFWASCFTTTAGGICGFKYTMDGVQSNSWSQQWFNEANSHKDLSPVFHVWNCSVYNLSQSTQAAGAVQLAAGSHTFTCPGGDGRHYLGQ